SNTSTCGPAPVSRAIRTARNRSAFIKSSVGIQVSVEGSSEGGGTYGGGASSHFQEMGIFMGTLHRPGRDGTKNPSPDRPLKSMSSALRCWLDPDFDGDGARMGRSGYLSRFAHSMSMKVSASVLQNFSLITPRATATVEKKSGVRHCRSVQKFRSNCSKS